MWDENGLSVTVDEGFYVIVPDIPPTSQNRVIDASGREFPMKVSRCGSKFLLYADGKDLVCPLTFEMQVDRSFLFCAMS